MPNNSELTDYEPVIAPARRSLREQPDVEGDWEKVRGSKSKAGRKDRLSIPGFSNPIPAPAAGEIPRTSVAAKSLAQVIKDPVIKRGHALSYAGLFLFTFMVYFRPYELFSGLAWLSKTTFWIGIITLAVFIPTQLALENKLTRIREVNFVLLLLLACFISIPLALEPIRAWNGFTEYLKVVLMFIVLVNVVRTGRRLKALFVLVLVSSCVLSALAMNDYRHGILMLGVRVQGAIGGLFDNPNDLALHLVTMIPIAIGMLFSTRGVKKLFFAISAVLMVAGVVVTFSRGGFIGMVAAGGILTWRIARRHRWMVAITLPVLLLLFVMLAPGGYGTRLALTTDESASARTNDLKRSIFIASRHPLLGVGMDNYVLYSNTDHASHNAYTQVASELGIAAMVIYIMFQVLPLKDLRRISRETFQSRRSSHFYYLAIGLEASLVGYMVSSFFGSVAFLWYGYYIVGYAVCFKRLYTASEESSPIPGVVGPRLEIEYGRRK